MGMKNVAKHVRKIKHKKVEWRKGLSGMSNPTTTKHRLAAKRSVKKSELTVDTLRKFNERSQSTATQQSIASGGERIDDEEQRSVASTFKESVISWATCASDMTVRSFRGLFDKFEESGKHREAIAMIAACSEVLRARGLALNEAGYFAVLLSNVSSLRSAPTAAAPAAVTQPEAGVLEEAPTNSKNESLRTALFLLRVIVKRINRDVLRARFLNYVTALRRAFDAAQLDVNAMSELVPVVKTLIVAQPVHSFADSTKRDAAFWFIDRFCALLSHASLRKCVASALVSILRAYQTNQARPDAAADSGISPFASHVVDYCVTKLRAVHAESDAQTDVDIAVLVSFTARCADSLPSTGVRRLAEALLGVARRDPRRFSASVCDAFAHMFASAPRDTCVSLELTAKLLSALLDAVPTPTQSAVRARLVALRFGLANLTRLALVDLRTNAAASAEALQLFAAHATRAFETGLTDLVSNERKAQDAPVELCRSVFIRLAEVVAPLGSADAVAMASQVETVCCEVLARLNAAITLQNVASWRILFGLVCDMLRNLLPDPQNFVKTIAPECNAVEQQSSLGTENGNKSAYNSADRENGIKQFALEERNNFRETLIDTLRRLAALRENAAIAVRDGDGDGETVSAIDECLAEALRRCDVHHTVWRAVRIELRFAPRFSAVNDWLVALLAAHARRWSLAFWYSELLPLATACGERLHSGTQRSTVVMTVADADAVAMTALVEQVWMLLGSACSCAQDLDSMRLFGKLIADRIREATEVLTVPETRRTATHVHRIALGLSSLSALRKLVGAELRRHTASISTSNVPPSDILIRYAKNYLPLLFNLVTTEPPVDTGDDNLTSTAPTLSGLQLAALETIRLYASILEPTQLSEFADKACQKLDEGSVNTAFRRHALLDLLVAMSAHLDEPRADQLLQRALSALNTTLSSDDSSADSRVPKKYYRLLETICERASFACSPARVTSLRTFVLANLRGATPGVAKPRLRLLAKLIAVDTDRMSHSNTNALQSADNQVQVDSGMDAFVEACFPEAVLCLGSSSRSVRLLAEAVIVAVLARLRLSTSGPDADVSELVRRLYALLSATSGSEQLQVAVIRAFSIAVGRLQSDSETLVTSIFDILCALVASTTRAAVVRAALDLSDALIKRAADWTSVSRVYESCVIRLVLHVPPACQRTVRFEIKRVFERAMRKAHDVHVVERAIRRLDVARLADFDKLLRNCRKRIERAWRKRAGTENDSGSESDEDSQLDAVTKSDMRSKTAVSVKSAKSRRSVVKSVAAILDEAAGTGRDGASSRNKDENESDLSDDDRIVERSDEIVDLLDPEAVTNVRTASSKRRRRDVSESLTTQEFATAPDGRIILVEEREERRRTNKERDDDADDDEADSLDEADILSGIQLKSIKSVKTAKSDKSRNSQKEPQRQQKKQGTAGRSKGTKAAEKSDARRRGERFEPFAYVKLDRRTLNKRKKAKLSGRFENLVRSAKKGAASGAKANATALRKLKRAGKSEVRAQAARGDMDFD